MIPGRRSLSGRISLTLLLLAGAATSASLGACNKGDPKTVQPETSMSGLPETTEAIQDARTKVEMIRWRLEIENLSDILRGAESLLVQLQGGNSAGLRLRPIVESLAGRGGVPATVLSNLDWSGRWSLHAGYPQPGQEHARLDDLELAGNFSSPDPLKVLSGLPEAWQAKSIDANNSRVHFDELNFLVRAQGKTLLVGSDDADLERAVKLHQDALPARLTLRSDNMHMGDVDPSELLSLPPVLAKPLGQALKSANSMEALFDLSDARGLLAHLQVSADLSRFGFDFLGRPLDKLSSLADRLPQGAVLVVHMSWGEPKLIHQELDRLTKAVPEPFDGWIAQILRGAHATLDVVREEVILALYFDEKGRAAIVVASGVVDQAKATSAVREVLAGAYALGDRYRGLVGDDRDYRFKIDYKPEGLGFSKSKVDILEVNVPKALQSDARRLEMFFGAQKPELEILAHIDEKYGLVVAGSGARSIMSDWVRHLGTQRRVSTEFDGGLALARNTSAGAHSGSGCQICVAVEPTRALRMWLTHQRDFDDNKEVGARLAEADKLKASGHLALSLRASDAEAAIGIAAAPQLLSANPPLLPALMRLGDLLPEDFADDPPASAK